MRSAHRRSWIAGLVTTLLPLFLVLGTSSVVQAQDGKVRCKDGKVLDRKGNDDCSKDGGIVADAAAANHPVAADTKDVANSDHPAATATKDALDPADKDAKGASARCKDGTYSHRKDRTGACDGHGGVKDWLSKS
jgi:hypothetical protein